MPTQKLTIDVKAGTEVYEDITDEEQAEIDARAAAYATQKSEEEAAATQKATDQAAGNQKLLDLGLTQAEATALTGYVPPSE